MNLNGHVVNGARYEYKIYTSCSVGFVRQRHEYVCNPDANPHTAGERISLMPRYFCSYDSFAKISLNSPQRIWLHSEQCFLGTLFHVLWRRSSLGLSIKYLGSLLDLLAFTVFYPPSPSFIVVSRNSHHYKPGEGAAAPKAVSINMQTNRNVLLAEPPGGDPEHCDHRVYA